MRVITHSLIHPHTHPPTHPPIRASPHPHPHLPKILWTAVIARPNDHRAGSAWHLQSQYCVVFDLELDLLCEQIDCILFSLTPYFFPPQKLIAYCFFHPPPFPTTKWQRRHATQSSSRSLTKRPKPTVRGRRHHPPPRSASVRSLAIVRLPIGAHFISPPPKKIHNNAKRCPGNQSAWPGFILVRLCSGRCFVCSVDFAFILSVLNLARYLQDQTGICFCQYKAKKFPSPKWGHWNSGILLLPKVSSLGNFQCVYPCKFFKANFSGEKLSCSRVCP